MRRTGMAFQRTRLAADRTLMAVIRTSLSLISFGFTIYQIFKKLHDSGVLKSSESARNFGVTLVLLGIVMLILGIMYHVLFMLGLRRQREHMRAEGLLHAQSGFPASLTLIVALALLIVGFIAIASMIFRIGPYD
jgi:putative membrane protein